MEKYDTNRDGEINQEEKEVLRANLLGHQASLDLDKMVDDVLNLRSFAVSQLVSTDQLVLREDLDRLVLFPETRLRNDHRTKIVRSMSLGPQTLYIGAYVHNDHQHIPFGVYISTSLAQAKPVVHRIPLPEGAKPWDILIRKEGLYVLLDSLSGERTLVSVRHIQGRPPYKQRKILSFPSPTFARSFELLDGDFYFGLGTGKKELHPATGYILRVRDVMTEAKRNELMSNKPLHGSR